MKHRISRRTFVKAGAAASVAVLDAAATQAAPAATQAAAPAAANPTMLVRRATPPVVIASGNGNVYRNGGPRTCVEEAHRRIVAGEDVLDALIGGVNIVELDPTEMYVGYGGLPNADGVVQLDSCCMHGPLERAGGVAALEGVRTPSRVAKAVLDYTDHHLLVGAGAQSFARQMGFTIEDDLNTEASRAKWLEWKRRVDPGHWLDPKKRVEAGEAASLRMVAEGLLDPVRRYGTINCDGVGNEGRGLRRDDARAASRSRSPAASATRRSSAPGSGSTTRWARPAPPAAARRTSTTSRPSSSSRRWAGDGRRRTRRSRRCGE